LSPKDKEITGNYSKACTTMNSSLVPIVDALITAFLFLETCGDDEVDADSAVKCMENMSACLLELPQSGQLELRELLREMAANSDDQAYSKFVAEFADKVGLESS
jgi:hypothetical protein